MRGKSAVAVFGIDLTAKLGDFSRADCLGFRGFTKRLLRRGARSYNTDHGTPLNLPLLSVPAASGAFFVRWGRAMSPVKSRVSARAARERREDRGDCGGRNAGDDEDAHRRKRNSADCGVFLFGLWGWRPRSPTCWTILEIVLCAQSALLGVLDRLSPRFCLKWRGLPPPPAPTVLKMKEKVPFRPHRGRPISCRVMLPFVRVCFPLFSGIPEI